MGTVLKKRAGQLPLPLSFRALRLRPTNYVGLRRLNSARNPYYDTGKIPAYKDGNASFLEKRTHICVASGISHSLRGFELTSTETVRPPLSFRAQARNPYYDPREFTLNEKDLFLRGLFTL